MTGRWAFATTWAVLGLAVLGERAAHAQSDVPVVAVFGIEDHGAALAPDTVQRLSTYVDARFRASARFRVVPNAELRAALRRQKKAALQACAGESCQIDVAREVAARKVVSGTILKIGSRCIVTLTLFDLRESTREAAGTGRGACTPAGVRASIDAGLDQLGVRNPEDAPDRIAAREAAAAAAARKAQVARAKEDWARRRPLLDDPKVAPSRQLRSLQAHLRRFREVSPHAREAMVRIAKLEAAALLVPIPGGEVIMGCMLRGGCYLNDDPRGKAQVSAFRIDKTEVTVGAYRKCVDAGVCSGDGVAAEYWEGEVRTTFYCNWGKPGRDDHPLNCVTWDEARQYCAWVGKRLPTDIEWLRAARGSDDRHYPWGNTYRRFPRCSRSGGLHKGRKVPVCRTKPVGSSSPDSDSPYGVQDMLTGVMEWTSDWFEQWKPETFRSLRGDAQSIPLRSGLQPENRGSHTGFRCASSE